MSGIDIVISDEDIEWVKNIMPDIEFDECRINILKICLAQMCMLAPEVERQPC